MTSQARSKNQNVYNSVAELADDLGISRASAYKGLKNKEIPSIKIGRRFVVPRAAIRELFRNPGGIVGEVQA